MGTFAEGQIRRDELSRVTSPAFSDIRVLNCSDIDGIQDIACTSFDTLWSRQDYGYFLSHPCRFACGIFRPRNENGGRSDNGEFRLVSYLIGLVVSQELDVITVATHPDFRRQGLSELLFEHTIRDPNISKLFLEVGTDNLSAQMLYRKIGFTATGTRLAYYASKKDAYTMSYFK